MRNYKLYFLGILFFTYINLSSCKKSSDSDNNYFTFEIAGKHYQIATVTFAKVTSVSSAGIYLSGSSKDQNCYINILLNNNVDSSTVGNYIVSNQPQGINHQKIIGGVQITIKDAANPSNVFIYYNTEADFKFNIIDVKDNRIYGNFSGKMTGGTPNPGGFTPSAYSNIRTDDIWGGKFNTTFTR